MRSRLGSLFGIDSALLAVFRVGLGLLLLADLAVRSSDLVAHYTDSGAVPREIVEDYFAGTWRWSLHQLGGQAWCAAALFAVAALAAACLVAGWKTRFATVAAWVLWASLHTRNPAIVNAGDTLLLMMLFWSMFLPLGAMWSLDARLARGREELSEQGNSRSSPPDRRRVCSVASAAVLIQIAIVYLMTGLFKLNDDWLGGLGLYYTLSFDAYARPAASWLLEFPELCRWLTFLTLWSELLMPLFVFCPWQTARLRGLAAIWFVGLHAGIELTLTVGLFSWVSILAWVLFVPWPGPGTAKESRSLPGHSVWRGPATVLAGMALAFVVLWNATGLIVAKTDWVSRTSRLGQMARAFRSPPIRRFADLTMLYQQWHMFSRPARNDSWLVAIATRSDGQQFDLLNATGQVDLEKPALMIDRQANHRWRKFHRRLAERRFVDFRPPYCRYLATKGDIAALPAETVARVDLLSITEQTSPPGEPPRFRQVQLCREEIAPVGAFLDAVQQEAAEADALHPGI